MFFPCRCTFFFCPSSICRFFFILYLWNLSCICLIFFRCFLLLFILDRILCNSSTCYIFCCYRTIPIANNMPLLFFICAPPVFFRTYKRTLFILLYYTYINILIIFRYSFLTFPSLYVFFGCSLFSPTPFFLTFPENCTTIVTLLLCFIHRRILSLW